MHRRIKEYNIASKEAKNKITCQDPKFKCRAVVNLKRYDFSDLLSKDELQKAVFSKNHGLPNLLPKAVVYLEHLKLIPKTVTQEAIVYLERYDFSNLLSRNANELFKEKYVTQFEACKNLKMQKSPYVLLERCDFNKNHNFNLAHNYLCLKHTTKPELNLDDAIKLNIVENLSKNKGNEIMHNNHVKLRERKMVDYKERDYSLTPVVDQTRVQVQNGRIPIYRTLKTIQEPTKTKRDLYDFISDENTDSDYSFRIEVPSKKRKIVHVNKLKRKHVDIGVNRKSKLTKNVNKSKQYETKMSHILDDCRNKIKLGLNQTKPRKNNLVVNVKSCIMNNVIPESTEENINNEDENYLPVLDSVPLRESPIDTDIENTDLNNKELCKNVSYSTMYNVDNDNVQNNLNLISCHSSNSAHCDPSPCNSVKSADEINNTDTLFGFGEDLCDNKISNTRINVIQNVVLNESRSTSIGPSPDRRPQANKSWRFSNICLTRNPHFLDLKKNSLPSLNQDAVLDHTFTDHIDQINRSVPIPTNPNSPKQQSLLKYVESDKDHFGEIQQHQSLYDAHLYSPIKVKKIDKENMVKEKTNSRSGKRNILATLQENFLENKTSTPAKNKPSVPISMDLSMIEDAESTAENSRLGKYFGFNSASEVIEEEIIEKVGNADAKPFRLNMYSKKCKIKEIPEKLTQPVRDSEVRRLVNDDPEFQKLVGDLECNENNLFEDIETSRKCYKRTKNKKLLQYNDTKKKKPESKLSSAAKKWIKEFNKMCDEVDDFELEMD